MKKECIDIFLLAKVLKVDGPYCFVRFPPTNTASANTAPSSASNSQEKSGGNVKQQQDTDEDPIQSKCSRIMRKDELQVEHS